MCARAQTRQSTKKAPELRRIPYTRSSQNNPSRDCLESPDGHQTGATEANIEGQGDRIFALQASDLASLTPLQPTFQTVSLRGWVNKVGKVRDYVPKGTIPR